MEAWEAENSIGTNIVLWACYDNGNPWIAKVFIAVAEGWVWKYATQYNADTTLWCGTFDAKP